MADNTLQQAEARMKKAVDATAKNFSHVQTAAPPLPYLIMSLWITTAARVH